MSKKMKITIEFEDENGELITKPVRVERSVPWLKEFDNLGFRESFHMLETAVLEGRKEASDQAIEQLQKTLELDPNFVVAHFFLAFVYAQKAMNDEAIAEAQRARDLSAGDHSLILAQLGATYSYSGRGDDAKKVLNQLDQLSKHRYVSPFYLALIYEGLGQKDQALEWLEKAYEGRDHWLETLKVHPWLDSLRAEPRFIELLRKMGLEE